MTIGFLIQNRTYLKKKTQLDNDIFLQELIRVRKTADKLGIDTPQYILAGYSMGNIQDNILTELSNKYGFQFKFDKFNNFTLFGVKVIQTSHGNISGLGRIRGIRLTEKATVRYTIRCALEIHFLALLSSTALHIRRLRSLMALQIQTRFTLGRNSG